MSSGRDGLERAAVSGRLILLCGLAPTTGSFYRVAGA